MAFTAKDQRRIIGFVIESCCMSSSTSEVYIHLVWTTFRRLPLMTTAIERPTHRAIVSEAKKLGCIVLCIGGTEDHVHLLIRLPRTLSVASLAGQIKGVSSTVARNLVPDTGFGWQSGYGAFSVSPMDVAAVRHYIANQKQHHAEGTFVSTIEPDLDLDATNDRP